MDYKKVLLLHFTQGLSGRSIAEVTGVSKSAINEFLKRFRESKELYYPLPEDVTNETIAALRSGLSPSLRATKSNLSTKFCPTINKAFPSGKNNFAKNY